MTEGSTSAPSSGSSTPTTRSASKKELDHVLLSILNQEIDSPVIQILSANRIASVADLITVSMTDLSFLECADVSNSILKLSRPELSLLRAFKAWNQRLIVSTGIHSIDWVNDPVINQNTFDECRVSEHDPEQLSLIHISEPTRPLYISYAVFCLKKKN